MWDSDIIPLQECVRNGLDGTRRTQTTHWTLPDVLHNGTANWKLLIVMNHIYVFLDYWSIMTVFAPMDWFWY
jgi:hypothetical protein